MQSSSINYPTDKSSLYRLLKIQLTGLIDGIPHRLANLANASALLWQALTDINWVGFYLIPEYFSGNLLAPADFTSKDHLILGPFQGRPACIDIAPGNGVCGAAIFKDEILVVPNVHEFPGHIACDSASNSEIVIPLHAGGKVIGVLDIDSPSLSRFDEEDKKGLSELVKIIEQAM